MRKTPYYPLGGGLDLVTPITQMPDGRLIGGVNYEPWINGGYRRIFGYERFDGRPLPSKAEWFVLTVDDASTYSINDSITGDTSTATATICDINGNDLVVTKVSGDFQLSEGIDTATATITAISRLGGDTPELQARYRLAAEKEYRDDIGQVPGINKLRGIWQCRDRVYAIRDNAGETAAVIHKATATGWDDTVMEMAHTVRFDAGTAEFAVGSTLTGGTSGATGTIHRIILFTGSFDGNDATGYIALTSVTGTFSDNETITDAGSGSATANGASEQFALDVGGRYDFITRNFLASSSTYRTYAAGGVGPAFEIDEDDVVTPILLDLTFGDAPSENNPYLVEEFNGALWLMFPGGSLQKSVTGQPLAFNGFLGAAEFGLGEEGTDLVSSAGGVLLAFTRKDIHAFTPVEASFQKRKVSDRAGCVLHSAAQLSSVYAVDDSGVIDLQRVQQFGDFADSTVSDLVQPFVTANVENVAGVIGIRNSNQYRIYFKNGDALACRMKPDGAAEYGVLNMQQTVEAAYACEDENTTPTYWFIGDSGFAYRAESGRNFDGEPIESSMRLPFTHQGNPASRKRYRLCELEIEAERDVTLLASHDLSFAGPETPTFNWQDRVIGGGGFYDLDLWDSIFWDAQTYTTARFELRGSGKNISIMFYNESATTAPFVIQGITLHYDPRRISR
jgi:hypothetical protein